jgi:hypothetical protein
MGLRITWGPVSRRPARARSSSNWLGSYATKSPPSQ